jgi:flagellar assembly factor FliW
MTIESKPFGRIEISERQVIRFPVGIFGFEFLHEYALLDASQTGFYWLQSLEQSELAFILLNPYELRTDYLLDIAEEDLESIQYEAQDDLLVFAIVTIPEDPAQVSANLAGPVLINRVHQLGRQCIQQSGAWRTKHLLQEELARAGGR